MLKAEFFKNAMKAGMYMKLEWCIRAFSKVNEGENDWKSDSYTGRIVQHHTGHYFVNENKELVLLEDAAPDAPPYQIDERLDLVVGDVPNLGAPLNTRYGNFLFNWMMAYAFGAKLPYENGTADLGRIEAFILRKFEDEPATAAERKPDVFYVSEYLRYEEVMFYLRSFSQLCVWAATRKTILPPPGLKEFKAQLLKQYEGQLNDLSVIAKIDAALVAFDAEWLKGDPGGEKFLLGGGARAIKRKKKFLMHGAEVGMQENAVTGELVANSLEEGWDLSKFPVMNNSLRSGSFDRGAQTALGGVSVKWLFRASNNLRIAADDCQSKMGSPATLTKGLLSRLVGKTIVTPQGQVKIDAEETAGAYLGQRVLVRNPMYCNMEYTDYCKTCLGDKLAVNPYGLSVTVAEYGSAFLNIFLKKMHGTQLATAKVNLEEIFL